MLVIFDCDGVLVDSEFVASKIIAAELSKFGSFISTEEYIREFCGKDAKQTLQSRPS